MKVLVFPNASGVISEAGKIIGQALPEGAVVVDVDSLDLAPMTAARLKADGTVEIVPNHVGSGPWFDQGADSSTRLVPIQITEVGVVPAPTWAMTPRVETAAEVAAREADEAVAERARLDELTVTRFQARAALLNAGQLAAVEAAVAQADALTQMAWAEATTFRRGSTSIVALVQGGMFSESEMDALFAAAALIEA